MLVQIVHANSFIFGVFGPNRWFLRVLSVAMQVCVSAYQFDVLPTGSQLGLGQCRFYHGLLPAETRFKLFIMHKMSRTYLCDALDVTVSPPTHTRCLKSPLLGWERVLSRVIQVFSKFRPSLSKWTGLRQVWAGFLSLVSVTQNAHIQIWFKSHKSS
jgi:hypothetical protein